MPVTWLTKINTASCVRLGAHAQPGQAPEKRHYPEWNWRLRAYRKPGATALLLPAPFGPQPWVDDTLAARRGMLLTFDEIHVGGKGPRAMSVQAPLSLQDKPARRANARAAMPPAQAQSRTTARKRTLDRTVPPRPAAPALLLMLGWAVLLVWESRAGRLPAMALPIVLLLNLATFFMYRVDKHAAQTGRWRMPESTLHLLALLRG